MSGRRCGNGLRRPIVASRHKPDNTPTSLLSAKKARARSALTTFRDDKQKCPAHAGRPATTSQRCTKGIENPHANSGGSNRVGKSRMKKRASAHSARTSRVAIQRCTRLLGAASMYSQRSLLQGKQEKRPRQRRSAWVGAPPPL